MRRTALFVVAMATGASLLSSCGWERFSTFEDDAQVKERVRHVRIEDGSGDVRIRVAAGDASAVHRRITHRESKDRPGASHRVEGDTLVLTRRCGDFCTINYDITVPRDVDVTGGDGSGNIEATGVSAVNIVVSSGDVTARDVAGAVNVRTSSGSVRVQRASGSVRVRSGSGDVQLDDLPGAVDVDDDSGRVRGQGLRGDTVVRSGSGDVELTLTEPRSVRAHATSGSVTVRAPQGKYRVNATTNSGNRNVNVTEDPSSSVMLEATTTSGDVTITTG
ncbi:DUF4097 family beta strand repeat-containing protein [Streptoalloteichus hindustanus]|uniref:Putative adhesin n=1 Tax=Streptoalloteichus hindustanus TaxID=2017 RepID=A0A1M4UPR5_STRHI|nr:DUF4097 family beta strand repeat-containing protein [Streptoalloteichus hindustanus]SHE58655.1 Putative adhesin [Streptoalloteichus hindustanus]